METRFGIGGWWWVKLYSPSSDHVALEENGENPV